MDHHQYLGQRQLSINQYNYQSVIFGASPIKVEPDLDHGCQVPPYNSSCAPRHMPIPNSVRTQASHSAHSSGHHTFKADGSGLQSPFSQNPVASISHSNSATSAAADGTSRHSSNDGRAINSSQPNHLVWEDQQNLQHAMAGRDHSHNLSRLLPQRESDRPPYFQSHRLPYSVDQRTHESCETSNHMKGSNCEPNSANSKMSDRESDEESRQAYDLTNPKRYSSEDYSKNTPETHFESGPQSQDDAHARLPVRQASKPQMCKVCGKVLSSASSYYVHMKLHSGSKPYACTVCEAAFCRKPYLEVHMRTHTGERPYQCDMCFKRFTQKSSLNTHKRGHTGERPYSCDICHKTFAVKSYVTAHRWSHVSEKPLGCQRCGLTFTSKNLFALHIRTHIQQNHECRICGRTFMKNSYLIRHQNRIHREQTGLYPDLNQRRTNNRSPSNPLPIGAIEDKVASASSTPAGSPHSSPLVEETS